MSKPIPTPPAQSEAKGHNANAAPSSSVAPALSPTNNQQLTTNNLRPAFDDPKHHLRLYQGDCLDILAAIPESSADLVFADPPYFLSNGGITCHAGKMVAVHKGDWDKSRGPDANHEFNRAWLAAAQRVLKPNGSIWVSGSAHVIHSVGFAMQQLGFKLLNDISWVTLCTIARLLRDEPEPASQSLLPLFHPRHRNHHLGRQGQKVPPHLQLQAHEGNQSRQANEIRVDDSPSRALGEKIRQAPHPKTRRPPRTHPPRLHQRR